MPLLLNRDHSVDLEAWKRFVSVMDERLSKAVRAYVSSFPLPRPDMPTAAPGAATAVGFSGKEIADACLQVFSTSDNRHIGGQNPNYDSPAVPVIYAIEEATQQIATVAWVLRSASGVLKLPRQIRVLDVGSGLDAVAFALEAMDLLLPDHEIVCTEPSVRMRQLADLIDTENRVRRIHVNGSIESLVAGHGPAGPYSSLFFIYSFQYSHRQKSDTFFDELARQCLRNLAGGGLLFLALPYAKAEIAIRFKDALIRTRSFDVTDLSSEDKGKNPEIQDVRHFHLTSEQKYVRSPGIQELRETYLRSFDPGALPVAFRKKIFDVKVPGKIWLPQLGAYYAQVAFVARSRA